MLFNTSPPLLRYNHNEFVLPNKILFFFKQERRESDEYRTKKLSVFAESDRRGSLSEASSAHHESVLSDQTLSGTAHTARTRSLSESLLFLLLVESIRHSVSIVIKI